MQVARKKSNYSMISPLPLITPTICVCVLYSMISGLKQRFMPQKHEHRFLTGLKTWNPIVPPPFNHHAQLHTHILYIRAVAN